MSSLCMLVLTPKVNNPSMVLTLIAVQTHTHTHTQELGSAPQGEGIFSKCSSRPFSVLNDRHKYGKFHREAYCLVRGGIIITQVDILRVCHSHGVPVHRGDAGGGQCFWLGLWLRWRWEGLLGDAERWLYLLCASELHHGTEQRPQFTLQGGTTGQQSLCVSMSERKSSVFVSLSNLIFRLHNSFSLKQVSLHLYI